MSKSFRSEFESSEFAVRDILIRLKAELGAWAISDDDQGTVELVAAEALNNVVEHAYPDENQTGTVHLSCELQTEGLRFRIEDHGVPMPGETLPGNAPAPISTELQDLPEGGFGWSLIHMLAENLQYQRANGMNVLVFLVPLNRAV